MKRDPVFVENIDRRYKEVIGRRYKEVRDRLNKLINTLTESPLYKDIEWFEKVDKNIYVPGNILYFLIYRLLLYFPVYGRYYLYSCNLHFT